MKITLLSPFHGGSHQSWAEGYKHHSDNDIKILSLPDRFWKWRMHGSAITLAKRFLETIASDDSGRSRVLPEAIIATDMLDLTTFVALTKNNIWAIPLIIYMHENQLTYPLPSNGEAGPMRRQRGERDLHYAFINYASMLAADSVWFNSNYHRQDFFSELPRFLKHFPEFNELNTITPLYEQTEVMPVGIDIQHLHSDMSEPPTIDPPLILWNQRWEYDKNPQRFFSALYAIAAKQLPFRLAVCGTNYRRQPAEFEQAKQKLEPHIVHWGYADESEYRRLLWQADITISTADHEFFGISVVEAIACRTFPILPKALSYTEIIPRSFHDKCLYNDKQELIDNLIWALTNRGMREQLVKPLSEAMQAYDWQIVAKNYDDEISRLVANAPHSHK